MAAENWVFFRESGIGFKKKMKLKGGMATMITSRPVIQRPCAMKEWRYCRREDRLQALLTKCESVCVRLNSIAISVLQSKGSFNVAFRKKNKNKTLFVGLSDDFFRT